MSLSPFLALNVQTGDPYVKRYVNCTPANIGAAIQSGAADNDSGLTGSNLRGYVGAIKFGGSQSFLAIVGKNIFYSTDGGATWTNEQDITTFGVISGAGLASTKQCAKSGLWVIEANGVPTAVLVFTDSDVTNTKFYVAQSTNGTSWTGYGPFSAGTGSLSDFSDVVQWRGNLVCLVSQGRNASYVSATWDPVALTLTFATDSANSYQPTAGLCVFQDRLFACYQIFVGGTIIRELVAGTWSAGATLESTNVDNDNQDNKIALFSDNSFMYACYNKFSAGIKCKKLDTSLTVTDITSTVFISPLTSTAAGAKIQVMIDERTTPGSTPTIWLFYAADGSIGTAYNLYQWNGNVSAITLIDTGGSAADGMPFIKNAQGSTFWTSTENYVEIVSMTVVPGGLSFGYKVYSDGGSGTVSIRGWFGTGTNDYPLSAATLSGTMSSIAADNTTVHTITWLSATDGFVNGDKARFVLETY